MKQKFVVRIVCIILAVLIVGSVSFVALSANIFSAAKAEDNATSAQQSNINSLKTDFAASVGAELSSAVSAAPAKGAKGYVSGDYVNLRKNAGTNYAVITCMRKNTKFTYVDGKLCVSAELSFALVENK